MTKVQPSALGIFVMLFVLAALMMMINGCSSAPKDVPEIVKNGPNRILWAWERPEDMRFLDVQKFGVAFLAQTLEIKNNEVEFRPRRQPLEIPESIYIIAVTRIETNKGDERPEFSEKQKKQIVSLVKKSSELPNVKAIQIDFDVVKSERSFYRELIFEIKANLPESTPFTITSLASWCVGDTWFDDLPIDEAVPMAFEMAADDKAIREYLKKGNDWNEPLCRRSYGISVDDPILIDFKPNRRFFYFNNSAWKASDVEKLAKLSP